MVNGQSLVVYIQVLRDMLHFFSFHYVTIQNQVMLSKSSILSLVAILLIGKVMHASVSY